MDDIILSVRNLQKRYPAPSGAVHALRGLSFDIKKGKSLAIVGESGSGKTTAAMAVAKLLATDAGQVFIGHEDILKTSGDATTRLRRKFGIVLQNPLTSLDPRIVIWRSVSEPLEVHEPSLQPDALRSRALKMLSRVGIDSSQADRFPHQLSGGQLQRAVIARALILNPQFVILDEPTSALDVSVQAQVLNLLCDLRDESGLSYLFITHNLALVEIIAHDVLVMYGGAVVERGPVQQVFSHPRHPYTADLLAAVPDGKPLAATVNEKSIEVAPLAIGGCSYRSRCLYAQPVCASGSPPAADAPSSVACFLPIGVSQR